MSLTVCDIKEGEKRNESNDASPCYLRPRFHCPNNGHQLTECAGRATDYDYSTTIDVASESDAEKASDEADASDHYRHREGVGYSCDCEEVSCVDVDPRRS